MTPDPVWHTLDAPEVERLLETGPGGLAVDASERRLGRYGPNEIEAERQDAAWKLLLRQFGDPFIYLLLIASAVTAALGDYTDTAVILFVVALDGVIGFVQESRAREAMRALSRLTPLRAEVVRGGVQRSLESRELVPGDVVLLASGARVPADLRLLWTSALEVDESALTGESVASLKSTESLLDEKLLPGDQTNMAFAGTTVTRGRGRGIVTRTGKASELGRIAEAVRGVGRTETPLQLELRRLGRQIGLLVFVLAAVVTVIGLLKGLAWGDILLTAVALAVSSIPEGLPVVLTVTLAIGARRMARRNAIIRSLPAVETLGSTTVIGSDKTGTLTRNEMTVRAILAGGGCYDVSGVGYSPEGSLTLAGAAVRASEHPALARTLEIIVLANEAEPMASDGTPPSGDPTEIALHVVAAKGGASPAELRRTFQRVDLLPFEPERRLMATLDESAAGRRIHLKGAPEAVLPLCSSALVGEHAVPLDADTVRAAVHALAARGLRVLAAAYRDTTSTRLQNDGALGSGYTFAGLVGMEDPVRPEAVVAVGEARASGIRVLMLTGDHVETARAVGAELGLPGEAISGETLETLSDAALDEVLQDTNVYARVAPEQKLRIVQRLKAHGEVVAVTGDGVNDAPALRAAHLGVAMGRSGTDAAREASDMVLADDNFATITAAVEEGRIVFANVRKVTFFLLSTAVGEVFTILVALVAGWPLPFLAAQVLWINLVTNGLQDVALAFEPGESGLLRRRPRPAHESVLSPRLLGRLGGVGAVLAAGTLGMFWLSWRATGDVAHARTVAVTQMVVFQFFHVFNCRSLDRSLLRIPLLSNPFLFVSLVAAWLAHLAAMHLPVLQAVFQMEPLGAREWGMIVLVGASVILGGELDKAVNRRRGRALG